MKQQHRPITTEIFSGAPDVLIVDDDPDVAACLVDAVTAGGFSAYRAADGRQGLDHAESWPPRVVLLDLHMPVLDGWGFLDLWREHPELRRVPVVIVSSEPLDAGLLDTVEAWLPKPVDADELVGVVGVLLCDTRPDEEASTSTGRP